jgi:chromosome segregation ATPase
MDAMDEDEPEDEVAEDDKDMPEGEAALHGEIRRLRTEVADYRSANIRMNAKIVELGTEMQALDTQAARATIKMGELETELTRLREDSPDIVEDEEPEDEPEEDEDDDADRE